MSSVRSYSLETHRSQQGQTFPIREDAPQQCLLLLSASLPSRISSALHYLKRKELNNMGDILLQIKERHSLISIVHKHFAQNTGA
eukprot:2181287-Amphidinium_carterae.1